MRNLKRALSLVLAAMMLIGMMVVSAGAASKDFTDKDEIQHTEAVNTMTTLNVIAGKGDGSYFDPTGTLTRAEMAKLVTYILNGGVEPVLGEKVTPTYSDIDGHWAEKYIEYCTSMNIIAGDGSGKFNPEGTLTAEQCAKMLLTAMNYKDDVFGFLGNNWAINVNREANAAGLYDELGGLTATAPISRDDAAQMVYNAIQAKTMQLTWQQDMSTGEVTQTYQLVGPTLFSSKFNGTTYQGVLVATGDYDLVSSLGATGGDTAGKDGFVVRVNKIDGSGYTSAGAAIDVDEYFESKGNDLTTSMGKCVKVLYNNKTEEIYGIYEVKDQNKVVIDTTTDKVKDQTATTITIDGNKTSIESDFAVYGGTLANTKADYVTFIDNDGNGKVDVALVTPVASYKVSYVGNTSFTLTLVAGAATATSTSQNFADVTYYDGMAKDDIVFVSKDRYNDCDNIVAAEVKTGTVAGIRANANVPGGYEYQIDGTWYSFTASYVNMPTIENGNVVEFVAVGGQLYYAKVTSGAQSVSDVLLLVSTSIPGSLDQGKGQALVLFSDGRLEKVTTKYDYNSYTFYTNSVDANNKANGTVASPVADASNCGKLYKYTVDNDNVYTLTEAYKSTGAGVYEAMGSYNWYNLNTYDNSYATGATLSVTTGTSATIGGIDVADDAVIFLFNQSLTDGASSDAVAGAPANDAKVISGKDLKNLGSTAIANLSTSVFSYATAKTNGLTRVAFAVVSTSESNLDNVVSTSKANYGYLVSAPYMTKEDGVSYAVYQVWNGSETVTYKAKATAIVTGTFNDVALTTAGKGMVIGYDIVDDSTIKNVTLINTVADAVTGSTDKVLQFENTGNLTYDLTGDTVYLYVNSGASSAEEIGVAGGSIQNATNPAGSIYVQNVMHTSNGANEITLIVVDTENKLNNREAAAPATFTVATGVTVTVNDKVATSTTKIAAGDVIKITNNNTTGNKNLSVSGVFVAGTGDNATYTDATFAAGESVTLIAGSNAATAPITISIT